VTLLDSVAIVAYLDATNVFHGSAVTAIERDIRTGPLIASAVNYAELLTGAKLGHRDEALTRGFFRDLIAEVVPVDVRVADRGAEIRARHTIRLPDALILATADLDADRVITTDARWAGVGGLACEVEILAAGAS
jgi:predicted nucleic acid-binding protein